MLNLSFKIIAKIVRCESKQVLFKLLTKNEAFKTIEIVIHGYLWSLSMPFGVYNFSKNNWWFLKKCQFTRYNKSLKVFHCFYKILN